MMEKWKNIDDFGLDKKTKQAMREDAITKVLLWNSQLTNNCIAEINQQEDALSNVRFLNGAESDSDFGRMQVISFTIGYFNITEKNLGMDAPKTEANPKPKAEKVESKKE